MASKLQFTVLLIFMRVFLVGSLAVTGVLTVTKNIGSSGSVKAIGVEAYSDSACTNILSTIDWGTIDPGASVSKTIYLKNTGNTAVSLSMSTSGWNPSNAGSYITISWNKQGVQLTSGQSIAATLTASVSSSVSGIANFSVNIVIQGLG